MEKVVDGVELLRMIRDGEIKNKDRIKDLKNNKIYLLEDNYIIEEEQYKNDYYEYLSDNYTFIEFCKNKFEILSEENEKIDIDEVFKIEKSKGGNEYVSYKNKGETESGYSRTYSYFDTLMVKAVKQLNKKLEEK